MLFDKHANVVAQHQLEFPQYYPNPGYIWEGLNTYLDLICLSLQMA